MTLTDEQARIQEMIVYTQGNLTRAAEHLGMSKQYMMALVRRWDLNEWAQKVRLAHGHPPTGNPRRERPRPAP